MWGRVMAFLNSIGTFELLCSFPWNVINSPDSLNIGLWINLGRFISSNDYLIVSFILKCLS